VLARAAGKALEFGLCGPGQHGCHQQKQDAEQMPGGSRGKGRAAHGRLRRKVRVLSVLDFPFTRRRALTSVPVSYMLGARPAEAIVRAALINVSGLFALIINNQRKTMPNQIVRALLGGFVVLIVFWILNPFVVIGAGERGVVMNFGAVQKEILGEGLHMRVPIMQKVVIMDVRVQKGEGQGDAASKDLQQVTTNVALNYHLDPARVAETYQTVGNLAAVGDRIILPAVQESVKAATALYTAEELVSRRQEVRDKIRTHLRDRLTKNGVIVDEFSIVNFSFSREFNNAIESKTTAEQLKLKAERDLERIRIEAEQKVAAAKAEAESLRLQKEIVTENLIKLRQIEMQQKAIDKWDGRLPQVTGSATPFIDIKAEAR
jgi:prohibitin 2